MRIHVEEHDKLTSGKLRLHCRLALPDRAAWAHLAILHGYGDHSGRYAHLMAHLAERGVACHAVDFRGHGLSQGKRGAVGRWEEYLDDVRVFLASSRCGGGPRFLLGHSHGALVAVHAALAGMLDGVCGVILSAAFFRNRIALPWRRLLLARLCNRIAPSLQIPSGIPAQWLSADPQMLDERNSDRLALSAATPRWFWTMRQAQRRALEQARNFTQPLLMLVAGADPIADPAAELEFFERCGSPDKTIFTYPQMMHEVLRERERVGVFDQILKWMEARTPISGRDSIHTPQTSAETALPAQTPPPASSPASSPWR